MDKQIQQIILSISGKGVIDRRIEALEKAGFDVSAVFTKVNFGQAGTVKAQGDGSFYTQIGASHGGKHWKSGYHFNRCPVVKVTKK